MFRLFYGHDFAPWPVSATRYPAQACAPEPEKLTARLLDIRHRAREGLAELAETFVTEVERRGAVCNEAVTGR